MKIRTQARRETIVSEAAKLFTEIGYEAASMNELSKRLGGSKATLYGYFPSKESLLVAVVEAFATAHLSDATTELSLNIEGEIALESTLMRFGERMLNVLTNDKTALAIYRMTIAEAGRSNVGQLFYDSGPSQCIDVLTRLIAVEINRGKVREADPRVMALQFLALLTAETEIRLYQQNPPPLTSSQVQAMVSRSVNMFLLGAEPR
ncbi:TetR/AcrR family transcriptional regulator [Methylomonas paludis]|uniref:TetR/AcrR family transcriptional regulator n=1 Tax=Methylomonas paludis TaxID=1173101 RepID=A0A975RBF1_9GAMM|nr:TetR/AcrR family transcriptional regulator [Methylomonas paludis]QWF72304.1 TetR/AcrR family transcriptional regulator [Methylomonas paludis]